MPTSARLGAVGSGCAERTVSPVVSGTDASCGCAPVATPDSKNATAPVEGANSFTEEQAKERISEAGYADVTDLTLDAKGVWQAKAMKDGKAVTVALDYQGNIVEQ